MRNSGILLWAVLALAPAQAAVIYNNGAVGAPETVMYSAGPYGAIGDRIELSGTARASTTARVQLYNAGTAGLFDAALQFYQVGSPVGAAIGPEYLLTGLTAPEAADFEVSFSTFGLVLPDSVAFTLAVRNQAVGVDLGVNLYGTSVPADFLVETGSIAAVGGLGATDVYFVLEAGGGTAVPEPASALGVGLALVTLGWLRQRNWTKLF